MKRILTAAAVLVSATGCRGGETVSAEELAGRYLDAVGGVERLESIRTVHTLDSLEMAGLSGTSEAWWQKEPFMGCITVSLGPVTQTMLIRGDSVWSVDRNGILMPGDELSRNQAALAASTVFYGAFSDGSVLSALPDTVIEGGTGVARLVLGREGMEPATFYLSTETWLPVLMHTRVMGMDIYSAPSGWEEISGILSPSGTNDRIPALGQESVSSNILTEYNVPVPGQIFSIDGGMRDWVLADEGVPHPFSLDGEHIYLMGEVCGRPVDILLDSGAGATVIDSALAAELGLASAGSFSALGVGGSSSFSFVVVPVYTAAGATLTGQTVAAIPLDERFYPVTGHHIGLVLGYDFLSRFVTLIDYGAGALTLYDPEGFEYDGGGSVLEASRSMGLLSVEAVIEDSIAAQLLLDTGAGGALHFSPLFLERHPSLLEGRTVDEASLQGVGGEATTSTFEIGSLTLGSYVVEAGASSAGADAPVLSAFDGIIGNSVLARFRVYLDYSGQRVILEPSSLFGAEPVPQPAEAAS